MYTDFEIRTKSARNQTNSVLTKRMYVFTALHFLKIDILLLIFLHKKSLHSASSKQAIMYCSEWHALHVIRCYAIQKTMKAIITTPPTPLHYHTCASFHLLITIFTHLHELNECECRDYYYHYQVNNEIE